MKKKLSKIDEKNESLTPIETNRSLKSKGGSTIEMKEGHVHMDEEYLA